MRRFEIARKHLISAKGSLCKQNLWDPLLFVQPSDIEWEYVAKTIDQLIIICTRKSDGLPCFEHMASPLVPLVPPIEKEDPT